MERIENLRHLLNKECSQIVLFGAGIVGKKMLDSLRYVQYENVFVTDNDEEKIVGLENAITVEQICKFTDAVVVVCVACEKIAYEILKQLRQMGINNTVYWYAGVFSVEYRTTFQDSLWNGEKQVRCFHDEEAEQLLAARINSGVPFLFARWGSVEGRHVYMNTIREGYLSTSLCNNAGVYPIDDAEVISAYLEISKDAAKQVDLLLVGNFCDEVEELYEWYSPFATPCRFMTVPLPNNAWCMALKGKRVLIIHPFTRLIEQQYKIKDKIFEREVLPDFDLVTFEAVQSIGGSVQFASWLEAFEYMKCEIAKLEFDIALLGCGAYGMPLGAFIKEIMGKQAIHLGGGLQLFFGIKGRRWDHYESVSKLYNEYWVRPTDDLKPCNWEKVEGGCYW